MADVDHRIMAEMALEIAFSTKSEGFLELREKKNSPFSFPDRISLISKVIRGKRAVPRLETCTTQR